MTGHDLPTATDDPTRLADDLDRFGYCLARDLLSQTQRARIETALRIAASKGGTQPAEPPGPAPEWNPRDGDQWIALMVGEPNLDELIGHPAAMALARHLLGERFHLSEFSAHIIHPGNQRMDLHTDQWWLPLPVTPGDPPARPGNITRAKQPHGPPLPATHPINPAVVLSFMWTITPFTETNGSTRVVPGSHLSVLHPEPMGTYDVTCVEVPAGGAVIWDARTWHSSGSNHTDSPRVGILTSYCAPQFRQLRNFTCALRPEIQTGLSDDLRALLGFKLWSSYGATDDYEAEFARPGYEKRSDYPG